MAMNSKFFWLYFMCTFVSVSIDLCKKPFDKTTRAAFVKSKYDSTVNSVINLTQANYIYVLSFIIWFNLI